MRSTSSCPCASDQHGDAPLEKILTAVSLASLPEGRSGPAGIACARLAVTALRLTRYRNYSRLRLDLDERPVVLTGANGAGKTNLLEAVSYLGAGRGLRGARLHDVDHRGGDGPWAVAARLSGPDGEFDIGTGRDGASETARRIVRLDGKPAPGPAALAARVPVLWLTPAQDRLFLDRPNARRRYLDKLVAALDPGHGTRLNEYERALRERARLLRDFGPRGADADWLSVLERTMAETGIAIAAARVQAAADLTRASAGGIGPFPAARINAEGDAEELLAGGPALDAEDALAAGLKEARARDAEVGGASVGPHRSDMVVAHSARALPAAELSTGEQKTLLLAIVLAAARLQAAARGFAPILLLDEVTAHLDAAHRATLFDEIKALRVQAWLTGTDPALFAPLAGGARCLTVADGALTDPTESSPS